MYEEAFANEKAKRQQNQQQRNPHVPFIPPHGVFGERSGERYYPQSDMSRTARDLGLLDGGGVGRSQEATTEEILFGIPRLGGSGQPLPGYAMPQPRRLPPDMLGEPDTTGMLPGFAGMPAMPGTANAPEPYDRLRADPRDDPLRIGAPMRGGRGRSRGEFGGLRDDPFGGHRGRGMGPFGGGAGWHNIIFICVLIFECMLRLTCTPLIHL